MPRVFIGDTETTDISPDRGICDLGLIELNADRLAEGVLEIEGTAEALLNPGKPISPEAEAIHGISMDMVKDCPTFAEWIHDVLGGPIEGESVLIGYRVAFDAHTMRPMFQKLAKHWDVLPLAQMLVRGTENHKLQTMREHFKLPGGPAHRAMGDVLTTHQLLEVLLPMSGRTLDAHINTEFQVIHYMPWGKHKGKLLAEVPAGYRQWMLREATDLDPNLRRSLELIGTADYNFNLR